MTFMPQITNQRHERELVAVFLLHSNVPEMSSLLTHKVRYVGPTGKHVIIINTVMGNTNKYLPNDGFLPT